MEATSEPELILTTLAQRRTHQEDWEQSCFEPSHT